MCMHTSNRQRVYRSVYVCAGGRAASLSSAVLQYADEAWVDEM